MCVCVWLDRVSFKLTTYVNNHYYQTAASEMESAIQEMESQGVQSYILDLRNNPVSMTLY